MVLAYLCKCARFFSLSPPNEKCSKSALSSCFKFFMFSYAYFKFPCPINYLCQILLPYSLNNSRIFFFLDPDTWYWTQSLGAVGLGHFLTSWCPWKLWETTENPLSFCVESSAHRRDSRGIRGTESLHGCLQARFLPQPHTPECWICFCAQFPDE